jgi:hypothetical protein
MLVVIGTDCIGSYNPYDHNHEGPDFSTLEVGIPLVITVLIFLKISSVCIQIRDILVILNFNKSDMI